MTSGSARRRLLGLPDSSPKTLPARRLKPALRPGLRPVRAGSPPAERRCPSNSCPTDRGDDGGRSPTSLDGSPDLAAMADYLRGARRPAEAPHHPLVQLLGLISGCGAPLFSDLLTPVGRSGPAGAALSTRVRCPRQSQARSPVGHDLDTARAQVAASIRPASWISPAGRRSRVPPRPRPPGSAGALSPLGARSSRAQRAPRSIGGSRVTAVRRAPSAWARRAR